MQLSLDTIFHFFFFFFKLIKLTIVYRLIGKYLVFSLRKKDKHKKKKITKMLKTKSASIKRQSEINKIISLAMKLNFVHSPTNCTTCHYILRSSNGHIIDILSIIASTTNFSRVNTSFSPVNNRTVVILSNSTTKDRCIAATTSRRLVVITCRVWQQYGYWIALSPATISACAPTISKHYPLHSFMSQITSHDNANH